jgi:hypothetical protein
MEFEEDFLSLDFLAAIDYQFHWQTPFSENVVCAQNILGQLLQACSQENYTGTKGLRLRSNHLHFRHTEYFEGM